MGHKKGYIELGVKQKRLPGIIIQMEIKRKYYTMYIKTNAISQLLKIGEPRKNLKRN